MRRHWADVTAAEKLIGPVARTPLDDGLADTVDWYVQRAGRAGP